MDDWYFIFFLFSFIPFYFISFHIHSGVLFLFSTCNIYHGTGNHCRACNCILIWRWSREKGKERFSYRTDCFASLRRPPIDHRQCERQVQHLCRKETSITVNRVYIMGIYRPIVKRAVSHEAASSLFASRASSFLRQIERHDETACV